MAALATRKIITQCDQQDCLKKSLGFAGSLRSYSDLPQMQPTSSPPAPHNLVETPPGTEVAREGASPAKTLYGPSQTTLGPTGPSEPRPQVPSEERPIHHCTAPCEMPKSGKYQARSDRYTDIPHPVRCRNLASRPCSRTNKCCFVPALLSLTLLFRFPIRTNGVCLWPAPLGRNSTHLKYFSCTLSTSSCSFHPQISAPYISMLTTMLSNIIILNSYTITSKWYLGERRCVRQY
jgi:hypothetical protein